MIDLKKKLAETMEKIKKTTELFYQQKEQEGYIALNQIISSITMIIDELYATLQTETPIRFDQKQFIEILGCAMNAMEEKDIVLLADILQYDFIELLEEIDVHL